MDTPNRFAAEKALIVRLQLSVKGKTNNIDDLFTKDAKKTRQPAELHLFNRAALEKGTRYKKAWFLPPNTRVLAVK